MEIIGSEIIKRKHFTGDIIITDPCYICKKDCDDWSKSDYGTELNRLGITNFITNDTLYGDWGCHTYNQDTEEVLGQFCADAGLVTVCLLEEVLKYNPNFKEEYIKERPWCVTVIKDFDGDVSFIQRHLKYEHDNDYIRDDGTIVWKKGDVGEDVELVVVGEGNINFIGQQTSL